MSACVYVRWVDCIISSRQDKVTVPVWVAGFVAQTLNRKNNDGHIQPASHDKSGRPHLTELSCGWGIIRMDRNCLF